MSFIPPDTLNLNQVLIKLNAVSALTASPASYFSFLSISGNDLNVNLLDSTTIQFQPNKQYFLIGPTNIFIMATSGLSSSASQSNSTWGSEINGASFYNSTSSQYLIQYPYRYSNQAYGGNAFIGMAVLHPSVTTNIKLEYKYHKNPSSNLTSFARNATVYSNSTVPDEPDSYIYIYHN